MSRYEALPFTLVALVALALLAAAPASGQPLPLSDEGIRFPDGTWFTTATGQVGAYGNVLIVTQNGVVPRPGLQFNSIQAALDAIGSTLPAATADAPYLILVTPGFYEENVTLKEWVVLQGAGRELTVIRSPGGGPWDATVTTASNTELRGLSVENGFGGVGVSLRNPWPHGFLRLTEVGVSLSQGGRGLQAVFSGPLELRHVDVSVRGGEDTVGFVGYESIPAGVEDAGDLTTRPGITMQGVRLEAIGGSDSNTAIDIDAVHLRMSDVYAKAGEPEGYALYVYESATFSRMGGTVTFEGRVLDPPNLDGATVRGDAVYAIQNSEDSVHIRNCVVEGDLVIENDQAWVTVVNSRFDGDPIGPDERFKCLWVHDGQGHARGERCESLP